ncbi:MAG: rhodanese-like domain-containing protein [Anaerolinea sp.]|nr:rhodanese-like domain-containing protein [Anaerolinea sp.]MCC6972548.1 rhodanese-like domain-containing protein [Anaerolineae bacterium]CAG1014174.1 Sulfurtransferase [Anaerolineae bacterium]
MSSKKNRSPKGVSKSAAPNAAPKTASKGKQAARSTVIQKNKGVSSRTWGIITAALLIAAVSWFLVSRIVDANTNKTSSTPAAVSLLPEISVAEAATLRQAGAFILDVREPSEWTEFHIPGATLIPLGELSSRVSELPKDKDIVVVCRSGNRSQSGRDILTQAGFTRVTSMSGGMNQWRSAGYETVTGQ